MSRFGRGFEQFLMPMFLPDELVVYQDMRTRERKRRELNKNAAVRYIGGQQ